MSTLKIDRIHHVAYRCKDAKETVEWYVKHLNMDFVLAIAEDQVPSTKAPDPYMHIFLDAGHGNILAFFELPSQPEMGRDENTPAWVQHLALKVESLEALQVGVAIPGQRHRRVTQASQPVAPDAHLQHQRLVARQAQVGWYAQHLPVQ